MFFFFKQKTAYGLRISDWSSDVCSSDLAIGIDRPDRARFAASQQLFTKVLAGRTAPQLQHDAAATGLVATGLNRDWPHDWQGVMLAEAVDACEGRGAYLVRGGDDALPLALTAPHRGTARHTGTPEIGRAAGRGRGGKSDDIS